MAGAGGKGFQERTWADAFDETRDAASRSTPVDLPYGKHIMEIEARGGRGDQSITKNAYSVQTAYPSRNYAQPAYQVTQSAYQVVTNYPSRNYYQDAYSVTTNYPTRQVTPQPAYQVQTNYPGRSYTQPSYSNVDNYPSRGYYQAAYQTQTCLLYTSPSPRDKRQSRMPSSA